MTNRERFAKIKSIFSKALEQKKVSDAPVIKRVVGWCKTVNGICEIHSASSGVEALRCVGPCGAPVNEREFIRKFVEAYRREALGKAEW